MEFDDSTVNNDFEQQLLKHVVKSEKLLECLQNQKLLKALGPLNENWFEELNEQFNEQMFHDAFNEKEFSSQTSRSFTNKDDEKAGSCSSATSHETKSSSDIETLTQVLKQQLNDRNKFVYPSDSVHVATTSNTNGDDFTFFSGSMFDTNFSSKAVKQKKDVTESEKLQRNVQNRTEVEANVRPKTPFCVNSSAPPKVIGHPNPVVSYKSILCNSEKTSLIPESVITNKKVLMNWNQSTVGDVTSTISSVNGDRCSGDKKAYDSVTSSNSILTFHKAERRKGDCLTNPLLPSTLVKGVCKSSLGFTTASSSPITSSALSSSKPNKLLEGLDSLCSDSVKTSDFCGRPPSGTILGFQTASNKSLSISDAAWKNAQAFLENIETENSSNVNEFVPPITSTSFSDDKLCANIATSASKLTPCASKKVMCVGFKTASNKSMSVTAASWAKGQTFMDIEDSSKDAETSATIDFSNTTNSCEVARNTPQKDNQHRQPDAKVESLSLHNSGFKGKRRSSMYKPPRKRPPLSDIPTNAPPIKRHSGDLKLEKSQQVKHQQSEADMWQPNKRQLGVRQDLESQILVSDESLLKAVVLFEKV